MNIIYEKKNIAEWTCHAKCNIEQLKQSKWTWNSTSHTQVYNLVCENNSKFLAQCRTKNCYHLPTVMIHPEIEQYTV